MRSFSISTPTESIPADANGHADVVFTVANVTNVAGAGMARPVALGPTRPEWLALAGSEERDFPAGAIHQFAVAVNVPAGTPEGRYPFRLDVISTRKTSEERAESAVVTIAVPARTAAAPKSTRSWVAVAVLALLLVGGTGAYLLFRPVQPAPAPKAAPVPVTETAPAATDTTPTAPPVVESKLVSVPNLISVPVSKAEWELEAAGLKSTRREVVDRAAQPGTVRMHAPKPGEQVEKGTAVVLEVVIAADLVSVPNVTGVDYETARQTIEKAGLVAVIQHRMISGNIVRTQTPPGGEQVQRGSQVQLILAP